MMFTCDHLVYQIKIYALPNDRITTHESIVMCVPVTCAIVHSS